ncbi:MAG TPA: hypothetical protein ENI87_15155 [bacterium]|nr:hypothetical protein [bacterium]
MDTVNEIMDWVTANGDVEASSRLRMKVLPHALKENPPIMLQALQPNTKGSPEFMRTLRQLASEIVGKPVPATANQ